MRVSYLLLLILSYPTLNAQTARDFFLPAKEKNLSIFRRSENKGEPKFDYSTQVFFKNMGDSALVTTMYYDNQVLKGGQEQVVKITDSVVSLVRGKANTSQGRVETYMGDGEIIFKMPGKNGKTEWEGTRQKGAVATIYVAEFSKIKVNGRREKAVKISTMQKRKHSGKQSVFYIDYYVVGIGRSKRTSESGSDIEILEEQKYDPNPLSVK
jgi:hypothetical protein